jgi:hypothetical protein
MFLKLIHLSKTRVSYCNKVHSQTRVSSQTSICKSHSQIISIPAQFISTRTQIISNPLSIHLNTHANLILKSSQSEFDSHFIANVNLIPNHLKSSQSESDSRKYHSQSSQFLSIRIAFSLSNDSQFHSSFTVSLNPK